MFDWTLENTVVAGLFAALFFVVERLFRSRPALCHMLWVLALGVLLMPRLPWSGHPGAGLRRELQGLLEHEQPAAPVAGAQTDPALGAAPVRVMPNYEASADAPPPPVTATFVAASPAASPVASPGAGSALPPVRTWLLAIWLAGSLTLLVRGVQRILRYDRVVRRALPAPQRLEEDVARVAARLGVSAPEVRMLPGIASPAVWCLGRPRLLWPAEDGVDVAGASPAAREAIITHELAHLARRDHWVSWLEVPAAALFWWNPLFWLIRGRYRHFAELACDAWAVWAYPANRRAFAEALITMQARPHSAPVALPGLGATDAEFKDFEKRLHMIMKNKVSRRVSKSAAALAVVAAVLAAPGLSDDWATDEQSHGAYAEAKRAYSKAECAAIASAVESKQWQAKGEKYFGAKNYAEALDAYRHALKLDDENGAVHGRVGYILIVQGELESAKKHFKRQYALDSEPATALYNLACAWSLSGNEKYALEYVNGAVQHGFANTELMRTDTDLERICKTDAYREILVKADAAVALRVELARLAEAGDDAGFLAAHAELLEIVSGDGKLASEHGHLALEAGDYQPAAYAFGMQAELGYVPDNGHYNRACALALAGDVDGALSALERAANAGMSYAPIREDSDLDALREDSRYSPLQERIAASGQKQLELKAKLAAGEYAEALPILESLASDSSRTPKERAWSAIKLGDIQFEHGDYAEALAAYERAATAGGSLETAAFRMAKVYSKQGQADLALSHVHHAVQLGFSDPEAVSALLEAAELGTPAERKELVGRAKKAYKKSKYAKSGSAWGSTTQKWSDKKKQEKPDGTPVGSVLAKDA